MSNKPTNGSKAASSKVSEGVVGISMFFGLAAAVLIFVVIPVFLTKHFLGKMTDNRIYLGLTEGGIKLTFLFVYLWGISRWKEIRRVFEYHGAEHKVINAFEAGDELTVENVQKHTTVHVRCGTSFLLVVVLVSIVVFSAVPWHSVIQRAAYKLLLLPIVAGIAYEVIKFAGNRKHSKLMRLILAPGLLMQRITTQPPSDEQVEVAIKSLQCVREAEEKERVAES